MTVAPHLPEVLTRGVEDILPSSASLATKMQEKRIRVYLGIDPTGSLLTLGHSVVLRKLQQFAELGHEVILLIGNGTVRIGDPTGRDSTRPELTDQVIAENFKTWKSQASKVLDFDKIEIRHNGDWLDKLTYTDIVKLLAQTTVQQLLERDMFQERLKGGRPIFGHEIIYPLLQGYDSVAMDVDLEIGGTDQTFNMLMGRTLLKSMKNKDKWVLSTPIINGTDGRKMSKSYNNFIALTEPAIDMFGKLMKVADSEIITYFTVLTSVPLQEIAEMEKAMSTGSNPMEFKKLLARTITHLYHPSNEAAKAEEFFARTVQAKELPDDLPVVSLSTQTLATASSAAVIKELMPTLSNSEIRRLHEQGAVEYITAKLKPTTTSEVIPIKDGDVVRVGKRNYFKLKV